VHSGVAGVGWKCPLPFGCHIVFPCTPCEWMRACPDEGIKVPGQESTKFGCTMMHP